MNNQSDAPIAPSEFQRTQWKGKTIKIFIQALAKYKRLLVPHADKSNKKVRKEIKDVGRLIAHFREKSKEAQDDGGFIDINLMGSTYGLLSDIMHKHGAILESELKEKKKVSFVEGALEGEEKEVKEITKVLQNPFWQRVERVRTLVPHFSEPKTEKDDTKDKQDSIIQQQITIGSLYGQAVFGDNYGQLMQEEKGDILKALQDLFEEVRTAKTIPEEIKSNAIGDIQTIQSQTMKAKPDKGIVNRAVKSLSVLADASQVAQFALRVLPHLEKLQKIVEKLFEQ